MRRIAVLLLAAWVGACGGSSKSDSTPAAASGTIMGSPFTPVDRGAVITTPAPCNIPGLGTRSIAVLALGFSSFSNLCGFAATSGLCGDMMSSLILSVSIVNAPSSGTASQVGPGAYAIGTHIDGSGNVMVVGADIAKVDAVCTPAPAIPAVSSGSINISSVSPHVVGTLDLSFSDGSRFSGSFDAAMCNAVLDFCSVITSSCASTPCCTSATSC